VWCVEVVVHAYVIDVMFTYPSHWALLVVQVLMDGPEYISCVACAGTWACLCDRCYAYCPLTLGACCLFKCYYCRLSVTIGVEVLLD
jgi:hypothetical protein